MVRMKKKIALLLATLMLAGQGNFALAEAESLYIYVDAKAAEGGDGSFERPLKTRKGGHPRHTAHIILRRFPSCDRYSARRRCPQDAQ